MRSGNPGTRGCLVLSAVLMLAAAAGAAPTRDILIVDTTRPTVYVGMYRASQMTEPGWDLFNRSVTWANPAGAPVNTKVWLATYNGTLNPNYAQERDSIAVYDYLINTMGFLSQNIHVAHQSTIETANFAGYDLVIYSWTYPRNATNVLNQNMPFVTFSAGQSDELGIGDGQEQMHEYRDFAYICDNGHAVTQTYPLGLFTLQQSMWMDATGVAGNGRALVNADIPEPATLALLLAGITVCVRRR